MHDILANKLRTSHAADFFYMIHSASAYLRCQDSRKRGHVWHLQPPTARPNSVIASALQAVFWPALTKKNWKTPWFHLARLFPVFRHHAVAELHKFSYASARGRARPRSLLLSHLMKSREETLLLFVLLSTILKINSLVITRKLTGLSVVYIIVPS